jgi:hypothetical protein
MNLILYLVMIIKIENNIKNIIQFVNYLFEKIDLHYNVLNQNL